MVHLPSILELYTKYENSLHKLNDVSTLCLYEESGILIPSQGVGHNEQKIICYISQGGIGPFDDVCTIFGE
mgnify:FL=1